MAIVNNIDQKVRENTDFRQVLETGANTQVVIMSIPQNGEIGEEVHADNDQVLHLVEGLGKVVPAKSCGTAKSPPAGGAFLG